MALLQAPGLLQVAGEAVQDPAPADAVGSAQPLLQDLQQQRVWNCSHSGVSVALWTLAHTVTAGPASAGDGWRLMAARTAPSLISFLHISHTTNISKKYLDGPRDLWETLCGLTRDERHFLEGLSPVMSE